MHSSLEATAASGAEHPSNNGASSATTGGLSDAASDPAFESVYDEPEDPTGARQTLIQVWYAFMWWIQTFRPSTL